MDIRRAIILLPLLLIPRSAQGQFSSTAKHISYSATLPATCNPGTGDVHFKTTATVGPYYCSATNTWTAMFGGGGGGATIPAVTNVIKGDGAGNGADTKVAITSPATAATIAFVADNEVVTLPNGTLLANNGSGASLTFPGTLSIASGKTLTASNTLTFTGTDTSSVAFGTGGTVLYGNQSITLSGDASGSGTTAITVTNSKINGTTVPTNAAADQFLGTTASATAAWASVPNCQDSGGNHMNYNTGTHAFSCGTSSSAGAIPSVTNVLKGNGTGGAADTKVSITSPTTAGVLAFPTDNATITFQGTDTYIGRATTDTLTNKTLTNPSLGAPASCITQTFTAGTGGTTAGLLVKFDSSGNVITINTSEANPVIGVAMSTVLAAASVEVGIAGVCQAVADNNITIGRPILVGQSTAGRSRDSGQSTVPNVNQNLQVIGTAQSTATTGNLFEVALTPNRWGMNLGQPTGTLITGNGGTGNTGGIYSVNSGRVNSTGNTASIATATVCSSANCPAGQYVIHYNFVQGGTACSNVAAGSVSLQLTWTDASGAHSAVTVPIEDGGNGTPALGTTFKFQTSNTAAWADGKMVIWSTGSAAIQYATTYTACTTGTGTYEVDIAATRIQ